ncbi:beta-1,4-xylosyltransferase IRX14-like [Populus alba x Populus x berolinensis]|uniref:Glycosyltransferases n=1 Tax=Populus alba x Populus x berolinensis TaxID=444605 RepID=A0AAD6VW49_9ROSI|nr:beta-1,4-xylosyltransferase IRX14-like [Populus alba x Populus x berolinensis]
MKFSLLQQSYNNRRSGSFRGSSAPLDSSPDNTIKSPAAIFWLFLHGICCLISLVLGFRFSRLVFFFLFSTSTTTTLYVTTPFHPLSKTFDISNPLTSSANDLPVINKTTLHMTGVMHSLMLLPYDVVWIVVEAGGATNETALIIAKSGVKTLHIGFNQKMPNSWEGRHRLETKMRLRALRVVREEKMDGIVMFADDSNMHSMELFDEIQNVKWFGAVSVGILVHSGGADETLLTAAAMVDKEAEENLRNPVVPVQGPACNASNKLVGWHTFNSLPYEGKSAVYIDDRATVLPRKLEWAGFVLNSRLLWKEAEDKPEWVKDLDLVDENIENPLALLKDPSMVEPLGAVGDKFCSGGSVLRLVLIANSLQGEFFLFFVLPIFSVLRRAACLDYIISIGKKFAVIFSIVYSF